MRRPFVNRLNWSVEKNLPDIRALTRHGYPDFVHRSKPPSRLDDVPVFCFHQVTSERFEEQLGYLARNGYRSLTARELWEISRGSAPNRGDAVVLTFDDGTVSLWTVAFPLLEKYGYHAIAFIIPGCIEAGGPRRPTLKAFWRNRVALEEIETERSAENPLCTWEEIRAMHESGVVEFQSHTLYHHRIPTSPEVIDFLNPDFDRYFFCNIHVPVYREKGRDRYDRDPALGTPIYRSHPRMASRPRYFDSETIRAGCRRFVAENGGARFFRDRRWRKRLFRRFRELRDQAGGDDRYETPEEQRGAILTDLRESKRAIEKHLPGHEVTHLCYPWFQGSDLSVALSREVGYLTNFWGVIPGRSENMPGSDPYEIVRLEDRYLFRLPGVGRKSLCRILSEKFRENIHPFARNLRN